MAGPKRWPPLIIPQLPPSWIRAGITVAVIGALLLAGDTGARHCGFGDELCRPWLGTLFSALISVFWFWLLAPCALIALGLAHIARVTVGWLRLDVLRPRRG